MIDVKSIYIAAFTFNHATSDAVKRAQLLESFINYRIQQHYSTYIPTFYHFIAKPKLPIKTACNPSS